MSNGLPGLEDGPASLSSPGSPRLDRLSLRSECGSESGEGAGSGEVRTVVTALLAAATQPDTGLQTAAAESLASLASIEPVTVLTEWQTAFSRSGLARQDRQSKIRHKICLDCQPVSLNRPLGSAGGRVRPAAARGRFPPRWRPARAGRRCWCERWTPY